MSMSSKYEIRPMCPKDYDQVLSLLSNSFFRDEPLVKCLQAKESLQFSKNIIDQCMKDECSFVAYDTDTNEIVGACLNEISEKSIRNQEVNEPDEKLRFILQIFAYMHKNVNVFDRLNTDKLLHILMLSVDKVARGHALGSRMIEKSIGCAQELKFKGVYAEASNFYSLNCFKQCQFDIIHEVNYAKYSPERLGTLIGPMYDRCYFVTRSI